MSDAPPPPEGEGEGEKLHEDGLIGHLVDLRNCLLRSLIAIAALFLALFAFHDQVYDWFTRPIISQLPGGSELIATDVLGGFLVPAKVVLFCAFCLALPYVLYQLWSFVAPGLYRRERGLMLPLVVTSTLLFYLGMAFAYLLVFQVVFGFVFSFAPDAITVMPDAQSHLSFVLTMFLVFGAAFEVPIAILILVRMGVVDTAALRRARPYVIVGAFVCAAVITPPDVLSQFMLAVPVWLLYEAGIIAAALVPRGGREEGGEKAQV